LAFTGGSGLTSTAAEHEHPAKRSGTPMLWIGVLAPAIIWKVRFWLSYITVPYACWWDASWLLNVITVVTLVLLAGTGWYAWRRWRDAGQGAELEQDGLVTRTRFLGVLGMLSSGMFFYVVFAEGLANFFVSPCM
jgi:formate hydrogenlyase subunit 3/multisubunit Na+/H+ antiporter MnhD subunit